VTVISQKYKAAYKNNNLQKIFAPGQFCMAPSTRMTNLEEAKTDKKAHDRMMGLISHEPFRGL